jgi:hypothetical protein
VLLVLHLGIGEDLHDEARGRVALLGASVSVGCVLNEKARLGCHRRELPCVVSDGVPNVELYTRQTSALGQIVGIDLWPQIKALTCKFHGENCPPGTTAVKNFHGGLQHANMGVNWQLLTRF